MKKIYFECAFIFLFYCGFSQEPLFLSTNQSLVYLNPSFAGSNKFSRIQLSYSNIKPVVLHYANGASPRLHGDFVSILAGFDTYIKPLRAGISFSYLHDNQLYKRFIAETYNVGYAQHISLLDKRLNIIPSLQFGISTEKLDRTSLTFGDLIDVRHQFSWNSSEALPVSNRYFFDLNSGLLINYKNIYVGASGFHINQPNAGLLGAQKIPIRLGFHASYNWHINNRTLIHVLARYEKQQSIYTYQTSITAVLFGNLILGTGFLHQNIPTGSIGFRTNFVTFQLNYAFLNKKTHSFQSNTVEASLSFNLGNFENRRKLTDIEKW